MVKETTSGRLGSSRVSQRFTVEETVRQEVGRKVGVDGLSLSHGGLGTECRTIS